MLQDKLYEDLKKAMKTGNNVDKSTIQLLRAEILKEEKNKGGTLLDDEIINIVNKEMKKRTDALAMFEKAHRTDLTEQTMMEITCLNRYLPKQLTDDELKIKLEEIIAEFEAGTPFGKIMGYAKAKLNGLVTGKRISDMLKELLEGESND